MIKSVNKNKTTIIALDEPEMSSIVKQVVDTGEKFWHFEKGYKTLKGAKIAIARMDLMPTEHATFVINGYKTMLWTGKSYIHGYQVKYAFI